MNYIILDLEWDSAYCKKKGGFVNQIIQIGAVKLNENFELTDKFERVVRSCISKKVTRRFTELTGITSSDMISGVPLKDAVADYNNWIGSDTVTLTWSTSDIYAIFENAKLFLDDGNSMKIEKYVDLQSFVQFRLKKSGHEIKNQISLSAAAELFEISIEDLDMHTALDDSFVTAQLLKKTYDAKDFTQFVKDAADPEFYARLTYKNHYISHINDENIDRSQLIFKCEKCGKTARRLTKWKFKNRWFSARFLCKHCQNSFIGKVMFKKTYNSVSVRRAVVVCPLEQEKNDAISL